MIHMLQTEVSKFSYYKKLFYNIHFYKEFMDTLVNLYDEFESYEKLPQSYKSTINDVDDVLLSLTKYSLVRKQGFLDTGKIKRLFVLAEELLDLNENFNETNVFNIRWSSFKDILCSYEVTKEKSQIETEIKDENYLLVLKFIGTERRDFSYIKNKTGYSKLRTANIIRWFLDTEFLVEETCPQDNTSTYFTLTEKGLSQYNNKFRSNQSISPKTFGALSDYFREYSEYSARVEFPFFDPDLLELLSKIAEIYFGQQSVNEQLNDQLYSLNTLSVQNKASVFPADDFLIQNLVQQLGNLTSDKFIKVLTQVLITGKKEYVTLPSDNYSVCTLPSKKPHIEISEKQKSLTFKPIVTLNGVFNNALEPEAFKQHVYCYGAEEKMSKELGILETITNRWRLSYPDE